MRRVVSDVSWLQSMLDVESALANAEAELGVIPANAATEIAAHAQASAFDVGEIGRDAVHSANPVVPLVKGLQAKVSNGTAPYVHFGATSQDVIDTAMVLVARAAIGVILDDLRGAASCAATIAERHRTTVMAARTLMQQASVTSFGLKAAGWLMIIVEAAESLHSVLAHGLAVQFGGAVGTLAALGGKGIEVGEALASKLRLNASTMPWHTDRTRLLKLASAVAMAAGAAGKVAVDIVMLSQTEVAEVRERPTSGRGGSSALPQKQNPVYAVEILAAVRGVNAQVGVLLGAMPQEHERAAGAWQSEWPAVSEMFLFAGGATSRLMSMLSSLEVDAERMRRNLDLTDGLVMAEHVVIRLSRRTDPARARALVDAAIANARATDRPFEEVLTADEQIRRVLTEDELASALDPRNALGESSSLIDRALARYRELGASSE